MAGIDVLSDVFATLRLHGGVYFRAELSGAWAIEMSVCDSPTCAPSN